MEEREEGRGVAVMRVLANVLPHPPCQLPMHLLSQVSTSVCLHSQRWFAQLNVRRNWVASRLRDLPKAGESGGFKIRSWGFGSPFSALRLGSVTPQLGAGELGIT